MERSRIIDRAFSAQKPAAGQMIVGRDLVEIVLSGGYPEALDRKRWGRKQDWYHGYLDAIVQRDVRDVAQIEQLAIMPKLLVVLANAEAVKQGSAKTRAYRIMFFIARMTDM